MDKNTQDLPETTDIKLSLLRNSIVVAVIFLIIGALVSGTIVFWTQKQMLNAAQEEVRSCTGLKTDCDRTNPTNSKTKINWTDKLLLSKEYGKFKVGAYNLSDSLAEVFVVSPMDSNGLPATYPDAYALSFASDGFLKDNLFDVVGDKIYVLNQNGSFINVYTFVYSDETPAAPAFFTISNIGSINGPKYAVGVPYSIKCQDNICQLMTAHHQQSGCEMKLDLKSKQYTDIECTNMNGNFNPKPLN